jgi:NADH-quinone oxidoreductase subunit E
VFGQSANGPVGSRPKGAMPGLVDLGVNEAVVVAITPCDVRYNPAVPKARCQSRMGPPDKAESLLAESVRQEIDHSVAKFPEGKQQSALIDSLHAAQHHNGGYLTPELIEAVADYLGLEPIRAHEVATFYSMFETRPVGRHSISVCTNVSCMLCGGEGILAHLEKKLGIQVGQSTPDNKIYLKKEEECLAACDGAPMMMVDHRYYENLTPEKVDSIIEELE